MHQRFVERLETALHKLRVAAECGRLRDPAVANRRLGRLLQRYQRGRRVRGEDRYATVGPGREARP